MTGRPAAHRSPVINRNFALLWGGQSVSQFGSAITLIVLPLITILALDASTLEVSVVASLGSLPALLLGLPAGALIEGRSKRLVMQTSDLLQAVALLSIPVAIWTDSLTLAQVFLVAFVAGAGSIVFEIAYQSYLPAIVEPDDLVAANGKLEVSGSVASLGGPVVAGLLTRGLGLAGAVLVDVVTYLVSMVSLAYIRDEKRAPSRGGESRPKVALRSRIGEGLRLVVRHPVLRRIAACAVTANLFAAMFNALLILFLIRALGATTTEVGVALSFGAVGGIVGGLCADAVSVRFGRMAPLAWPLVVVGWTILLVPLASPGWGLAFVAIGLAGSTAAIVIFITGSASYEQTICPPEVLTRVMASLRWLGWCSLPVGSILGGIVGELLGLRTAIGIAALGCWVAGFGVLPLRRMPPRGDDRSWFSEPAVALEDRYAVERGT